MNHRRAVVPAVVGVVVLTAVAFGPLVTGLSLASESTPAISNDGTLTIETMAFPTNATVGSASYGAANVYLSVPPTTVRFESIAQTPTLIYRVRVPELGYSVSTTHFLNADEHGPTYEATIEPFSIDESELDNSQYAGELSLIVRDSDGRRVAARQNITIEVVE